MILLERAYDHPHVVSVVGALQAYYQQVYGGGDEAVVRDEHFSPPNGLFLVGYLSPDVETPVAAGGWRWIPDQPTLPWRRVVEVKRVYVAPGHRGRGLARQMMARLQQTAADAGATAAVMETGERQPEAIGLYRSLGYHDVDGRGWSHYCGKAGSVHLGRTLTPGSV